MDENFLSKRCLKAKNIQNWTKRLLCRATLTGELARRGALLAPSAIPCSLSFLTSRIHSRLISDWRRTVSSEFFDTQVSSISTEELVLPRHCIHQKTGFYVLFHTFADLNVLIQNVSCTNHLLSN